MRDHEKPLQGVGIQGKANLAAAKKLKEIEDADKCEVDKVNERLAASEIKQTSNSNSIG